MRSGFKSVVQKLSAGAGQTVCDVLSRVSRQATAFPLVHRQLKALDVRSRGA